MIQLESGGKMAHRENGKNEKTCTTIFGINANTTQPRRSLFTCNLTGDHPDSLVIRRTDMEHTGSHGHQSKLLESSMISKLPVYILHYTDRNVNDASVFPSNRDHYAPRHMFTNQLPRTRGATAETSNGVRSGLPIAWCINSPDPPEEPY